MIGPILLGAIAAAAALMLLAARRQRVLSDRDVAELDRAADLGGALRSAFWFADPDRSVPSDGAAPEWVAFHLDEAASRAGRVDWKQVYAPSSSRRALLSTVAFALVTVGLSVAPWSLHLARHP